MRADETKMARGKQKQLPFFPAVLDTVEFKAAWELWESDCAARRVALTDQARKMQLTKCAEMGVERALVAIAHSIENHYRSPYEPHNRLQPKQPPQTLPGYRKPLPSQKDETARVKAANAETLRIMATIPDADVRRLHVEVMKRDPGLRKYLEKADPRTTPGLRGAIVELWKAEQSG